MSQEPMRRVGVQFDKDMYPSSKSAMSPENFKPRALVVLPAHITVPVIFIPGIMGTNLKNTKTKKPAWSVPNGKLAGLVEGIVRAWQTPASRQNQLNPDACDVDEVNGPLGDLSDFLAMNPEEAQRRHWGEIHADSYLDILKTLEDRLNYPFSSVESNNPVPEEIWKSAMNPDEKVWTPKSPLTEDEFKNRMGAIYFPVYACGYNWLQSNEESAKRVIKRINEIEARLKDHKYFKYSGKVILVTHSMGGLVARRAVQDLGSKVLGVIHGVQPVGGAPVVYRRFRAGTEVGFLSFTDYVAAKIVGYTAADITAVMANAPGPMELLPTKGYPTGWLHFTDGKTTHQVKTSDPYEEIYSYTTEKKWWGMVNSNLIDPSGLDKIKQPDKTPEDYFKTQLKFAKKFHDTIGNSSHEKTYLHFGDDEKQQSFPFVAWHCKQDISELSLADIQEGILKETSTTGETVVDIQGKQYTFTLEGKNGSGDGTVPTPSGEMGGQLKHVADCFRLKGFDHQKSYDNPHAQQTVLHAFGKLAQDIPV